MTWAFGIFFFKAVGLSNGGVEILIGPTHSSRAHAELQQKHLQQKFFKGFRGAISFPIYFLKKLDS
jgi:hypothetical protein